MKSTGTTEKFIGFESRFDRFPAVSISGGARSVIAGWTAIADLVRHAATDGRVAIETYHGVDIDRIIRELDTSVGIADTRSLMKPPAEIEMMVFPDVTDDRVFGRMTRLDLQDYFDVSVATSERIVIGPGAVSLTPDASLIVYADMPRWEIQQRQRAGLVDSLGMTNRGDDAASLYKRSYFVDWRVLDRRKKTALPAADFYLETTDNERPLIVSTSDLMGALDQATAQPFELMPFFDSGVWGGHWMEEVCRIDAEAPNQAWCFNCVPEENSLLLEFGQYTLEIPSINLVFFRPRQLLGDHVRVRFGDEFPIRFDFLDTMGGQNLSLQVHPTADYMDDQFGVPYTQDESYYMLDAGPDAVVYLGLKEAVEPAAMQADLEDAQSGKTSFPADAYVNTWPARKHDHFLIPAGTIHCSGADSMVLEISATPYIFTFKLWDWGRAGMDGRPRPINIERGLANIQWNRDTEWTRSNLVSRIEPLRSGDGWREERTGLHELEFIETRRYWFTAAVDLDTGGTEEGSVHVLNLVEGQQVTVESQDGAFAPMLVGYAETFVVPAAVGDYTLRPSGASEGQEVAVICASVRS